MVAVQSVNKFHLTHQIVEYLNGKWDLPRAVFKLEKVAICLVAYFREHSIFRTEGIEEEINEAIADYLDTLKPGKTVKYDCLCRVIKLGIFNYCKKQVGLTYLIASVLRNVDDDEFECILYLSYANTSYDVQKLID